MPGIPQPWQHYYKSHALCRKIASDQIFWKVVLVPYSQGCRSSFLLLVTEAQGIKRSASLSANLNKTSTGRGARWISSQYYWPDNDNQQPQTANHKMIQCQKKHDQLCATFLEDLVEAIVLHCWPNLVYESIEFVKQKQILKQLQYRE